MLSRFSQAGGLAEDRVGAFRRGFVIVKGEPQAAVRTSERTSDVAPKWMIFSHGKCLARETHKRYSGRVSHLANEFPIATVGALIVNGRGELLMVRTHKWSHCWGIPGGKIKRGETCEAALRREVREETAIEITDIKWVMVQDCIEPPEFERSAHFLLLNYIVHCADAQPKVLLNDEAEEFRWVTVRQARELRLNQPTRVLVDEALRLGFIRDDS